MTPELRAALHELRDASLSVFQRAADERHRLEEIAGWIPSLDGPQLVDVAKAMTLTLSDLSALAIKWATAADQLLLAVPDAAAAEQTPPTN